MTKTLIAYFSRTGENFVQGTIKGLEVGNTEIVARKIQEFTGGDLFKIDPVVPYDDDYDICSNQARQDFQNQARPEFKNPPATLKEYDTIYLLFPNYWNTMPMHVWTFLERYDFSNKTIKPLVTHMGSRFGTAEIDIANVCKGARVLKGLAVLGDLANDSDAKIKSWVDLN